MDKELKAFLKWEEESKKLIEADKVPLHMSESEALLEEQKRLQFMQNMGANVYATPFGGGKKWREFRAEYDHYCDLFYE